MQDDLRALQHQKWLSQKEKDNGGAPEAPDAEDAVEAPPAEAAATAASAAASAPSQPVAAASASSGASAASASAGGPAGEPPPLERLHVLPFVHTDEELGARSRIEFLAPELRRKRTSREVVRIGDIVTHEGLDFAVIKCEPTMGTLSSETDYFLDGSPLVSFEKVQFSAWGPTEMSDETLFADVVVPHLKGEYAPRGTAGCVRTRLFQQNQVIEIGEISVQVDATEPPGLGAVTNQTEIFTNWDLTAEFDRIHIVPFMDTLPRAYDYDIFGDYLKPYLTANKHKKFGSNELFTYNGVQFKVVACLPEATCRIGKATTIFCEGTLHPSLRNLLPPELLAQVSQLPPGLQMLLLNTERTTRELEDMLTRRRGLFEETLNEIDRFTWPPQNSTVADQTTCMICLGEFSDGEECRRLPCGHVFHATTCIDEWLRRCTDCPICKNNVDRAIRDY